MLCYFLRHHKCTYRYTAAQCLGRSHDVRLHAETLPCIHVTGTSHAALDLIQNQQDIPLIAQITNLF